MNKFGFYLGLIGLLMLASVQKAWSYEDVSNIVVELEDTPDIAMTIRDTEYGPTVVRGQGKIFAASFTNNTGSVKTCDFRYAAFDENGVVKQIYDGQGYVTLQPNASDNIRIPCIVDLPEGDYYFVPIVRFEGETKWCMMQWWIIIKQQLYWKLHVYENYPAPSCSYICQQTWIDDDLGQPDSRVLSYQYHKNEFFKVKLVLHNTEASSLSGRIKLCYERDIDKYWRGNKYSEGNITDYWNDCLTKRASIDGVLADQTGGIYLSFNSKEVKTVVIEDCVVEQYRNTGGFWSGVLCAYFLPEGKEDVPENWLLVKENVDSFFDANGTYTGENIIYTVNTQWFATLEGSVDVDDVVLSDIIIDYNRSNANLSLRNLPKMGLVYVNTIRGETVTRRRIDDNSMSFNLTSNGMYIVSILDKSNTLLKTIKILK